MTDLTHCERPLQLAHRESSNVCKRHWKACKPRDCAEQCAKCEDARNCRLQFSACRLRFAVCRFADLADPLHTLAGLGAQAQTPVVIGFQGCLHTLHTYSFSKCTGKVYSRCVGSSAGVQTLVRRIGVQGVQHPFSALAPTGRTTERATFYKQRSARYE